MGQKILVVDDDPGIITVLQALLEEEGFEVLTAYDGAWGSALALAEEPDLIITDFLMPVMGGYGLILGVRASGEKMPIIVCCGPTSESNRDLLLHSGANCIIEKPFDNDFLVSKVRELLAVAG
ncbi:MAG: response regulator [Patescibacteria group bacterium]